MNLERFLFPLSLFCLMVAGCTQNPEPEIRTQIVNVPVPVPCNARAQVGPRRTFSDTPEAIRNAGSVGRRGQLLLVGREERDVRIEVLESAVDVCSRVNGPSGSVSVPRPTG